jgi:hypothetical protein
MLSLFVIKGRTPDGSFIDTKLPDKFAILGVGNDKYL